MSKKDPKLEELLETALEDTRKIQEMSPDEYANWRKQFPLFAPNIPLSEGNHVNTSMEALRAIMDAGDLWLRNSPTAKSAVSATEVQEIAIKVFGQIIAGVPGKSFENIAQVKHAFTNALSERVALLSRTTLHYFPCHIFQASPAPEFHIGPVRFMSRLTWLDFVEKTAQTPSAWIPLLRGYYEGNLPRPHTPDWTPTLDETEERQKAIDAQWKAKSTCDEVGSCQSVAVVEVPDKTAGLSRTCAETAVRVAVDAFGLALQHRDALDLRGPGDEKGAVLSHNLQQSVGRDIPTQWSLNLPGLQGDGTRFQSLLDTTAKLRESIGQALRAFIFHNDSIESANLKRRWVEAMYWFGQARRERTDFVALVNAGIALDVLTQGQKAAGISRLCSGLFSLSSDDAITSSGMTLGKAVTAIYDEGRSQLSHGGRLGLLQELPISKQFALDFVAKALQLYLAFIEKYNGPDDAKSFMKKLPDLTL